MRIRISGKTIKELLEYLLVITIILENFSMLLRDLKYNVPERAILLVFCLLCCSLFIFNYITGRRKIYRSDIRNILLVMALSIGSVIVPGMNAISGVITCLIPIFVIAVYLMTEENSSELWRKFSNVIVTVAAVSLILYMGGSVLHIIPSDRTASFLYDGEIKKCNVYLGIQYESQRIQGLGLASILFNTFYRNCSFFIEAPFYNILLCIGLAAELSFTKNPRKINIAILVLAILSTYCTTGYIFLLSIIILLVFVAGNRKHIQILKVVIVPICVLIALFVMVEIVNQKQQSYYGEKSFSIRVEHMLAGIRMLLERPIFGHGYGNIEAFYRNTIYDQGYSVGLPIWLGQRGILMFMTYLIPFLHRIKYSIKKERRQLFFWGGCFVCFFMTACTSRLIFMLLLCSQLMWHNRDCITETI